jgi:hypothetical protein
MPLWLPLALLAVVVALPLVAWAKPSLRRTEGWRRLQRLPPLGYPWVVPRY